MSDELKPQSIEIDEEFRILLRAFENTPHTSRAALIAYIDAWGARLAGVPAKNIWAGQEFLNWNRRQEKSPVAIGKELGVARKVLEFAAAPAPDKEDPCGS